MNFKFLLKVVSILAVAYFWTDNSAAIERATSLNSPLRSPVVSPLLSSINNDHEQVSDAIVIGSINKRTTWYADHNEFRGIEFFLASQFSQFANRPIELVAYPSLDELKIALQNGDIDVIAAGVSDHWIDTTTFIAGPKYRSVSPVLVTNVDPMNTSNRSSLAQNGLPNEIVVIDNGYSEHIARQQFLTQIRIDSHATMPALVDAVSTGEIEAAVIDLHSFQQVSMLYPDLQAHKIDGLTAGHSWLTSHRNPTLSAMIEEFFQDHLNYLALDNMMAAELPRITEFSLADARSFRFLMRSRLPTFYDTIAEAAETVDLPTTLLAAVGFQESHWSADATSPTGVKGFMMLTQTTAAELGVEDRTNATASIHGGAKYLRKLYDNLPERIPHADRIAFSLASYNMGRSHVEDARILAQTAGFNPDSWDHVKPFVIKLEDPSIYPTTERGYARGRECATYVDNVLRYQALLNTTPYLLAGNIQSHTRYAVAP
ncbi:transglycosylase SLT domain-containing protein [uncultured Umboniibacter sp.]|uniref:transglycosylase SLT domain-containing protein n=1 Tax=uncultured Umboniibacter sp. TaxID=1798917 RepID=UPI00260D46BB|nr:transglycosylase SLT domain-containing protein [uncultured Umboniibacter sp.]